MAIKTYIARITTTGTAGSAAGSATILGAKGELLRIQGNWHASAPGATSDLTIVESDDFSSRTLYSLANSATDFDIQPVVRATDNAGAVIETPTDTYVHVPYVLSGGTITVSVAQSDALTNAVIVKLTVRE